MDCDIKVLINENNFAENNFVHITDPIILTRLISAFEHWTVRTIEYVLIAFDKTGNGA